MERAHAKCRCVSHSRRSFIRRRTQARPAHGSNSSVGSDQLGTLIANVYAALQGAGAPPESTEPEKPKGAVTIRSSVKPDHLISMIDGKPYRMLKRHLALNGHTPASYREAYNLPSDYPMVAASYAEKRRELAKKIGLGRNPGAKMAKPANKPAAAAKKPRGRKPAVKAAATDA